ncbi:hypothetical protein EWM64_g6420 [Hericium alpestre]|uniref:Uncharacterized protein n=1 Tax=Hericium alpestre TaxID=135208 RepID=A0A4Y9ZS28_9AGAM|nr:hypothetical protein EWM64_g6420 [Hericium alpestre]
MAQLSQESSKVSIITDPTLIVDDVSIASLPTHPNDASIHTPRNVEILRKLAWYEWFYKDMIAFLLLGVLVPLPMIVVTSAARTMFVGITGVSGISYAATASFVTPLFAHHIPYPVRMYETNGLKLGVVKAASHILERTLPFVTSDPRPDAYGHGELWVSLSRYDDPLVQVLEKWERWSRAKGPGGMGRRREGGDVMPAEGNEGAQEHIGDIFKDERWDAKKMVRSFARLGVVADEDVQVGKIVTRKLRVKDGDDGVVLDANREVRVKLYVGQVFMAWMWLIPAFSLPPPPSDSVETPEPVTVKFTHAELDFPIGLGAALIDIELSMQELSSDEPAELPARASTGEGAEGSGGKSVGVVHALGAGSTLRQGVEAGQALEV